MTANRFRLFSKPLLFSGLMIAFFITLAIWQGGTQETQAQSIGIEYIFDVVPTAASAAALSTLPAKGTTFYLEGTVYPFRTVNVADCTFNAETAVKVGTWRAWGTVADDGRLVLNQSFLLSHGTIEVQGVTGVISQTGPAGPAIAGTPGPPFTGPTEILSATGGISAYRGFNGEARARSYCSDPTRPFRYDRAFCIQFVEATCCSRR